MTSTNLPTDRTSIRGLDDNSLLRLYDRAKAAAVAVGSELDRRQAGLSFERVTAEVKRRNIRP